jgi:hypothetical protein
MGMESVWKKLEKLIFVLGSFKNHGKNNENLYTRKIFLHFSSNYYLCSPKLKQKQS